jgi:hypothetical protein
MIYPSERIVTTWRQAEDLILRDYIVSAASEINCGGGSNSDNPTNIGISDFSLVATTLDTNNAYKFMSGIEGMDRFGKMCAELKSWVIDLELLIMAA